MQPDDFYICWRPQTKSKAKHAACRQYVFDTLEQTIDWINSRRNSTELVHVEHVVGGRCGRLIMGQRCQIAEILRNQPAEVQ